MYEYVFYSFIIYARKTGYSYSSTLYTVTMFGTIEEYSERHRKFRRAPEKKGVGFDTDIARVLVVEDQVGCMLGIDRAIRSVLGITTYDVATTLLDAVKHLDGTYDLVLLDDQLPYEEGASAKGQGYDAAPQFRNRNSGGLLIGTSSGDANASHLDGTMNKQFGAAATSLRETLESLHEAVY